MVDILTSLLTTQKEMTITAKKCAEKANQLNAQREDASNGVLKELRVSLSLILRGLFLYIVFISVSVEWCIRKPLSSYPLLSHPTVALASHIALILT